ncbi:transposase [Thermogemmatispora sp.]|uniref:RNA-guided endonuclease InsQ/TnpB family protein n=1 Tax=Thermogemmatispora sp. TaxID=1968838 RepID=UPI00262FBCE3|nr:transposase [Thermogemmatispora sp.]
MAKQTYTFRLYPTRKQEQTFAWTLDRCRELYNAALQERKDAYRMAGKRITYSDQANQLPEIKAVREEYQDIYSQILQDVLRRVEKAFQAFFRRVKHGEKPGYPRFRGAGRYDSFTYPQAGFSLTHDRRVALSKIGSIKVKLHRRIEGTIKTCTIKREGNRWDVVFVCEIEPAPLPESDEAVGVDLGVLRFATLSTGETIENPRFLRKAERKLKRLQQSLARKKRGSHRRKKAARRVATAHRKVRHQRRDFLHKESRKLVNRYGLMVFEALRPANMVRRPTAKQDETGNFLPNGASAKAGLNKSMLDAGWSQFVQFCTYKAAWAGRRVVQVDPKHTSQICSSCGAVKKKDLSQRWHSCECGCELDRDHNAALNIKRAGLLLLAKESQARTKPSEDVPLRSPAIHG